MFAVVVLISGGGSQFPRTASVLHQSRIRPFLCSARSLWRTGPQTCSGRSADGWATGRVPSPAKVKTYGPMPSLDPARSVRGISEAWTPEPIQASMNFERTCAGWRDYRGRPGEQDCEIYGTAAETVPHLAVAKGDGGPSRLYEKRVSRPIRECEWDKGGGFTNSGPGDSQIRLPRSLFVSISYGNIVGHRVAARGNWRWTGATPPFCCPVRARGRCAIHIAQRPLGGSLPSKLSLAGRPETTPLVWQDRI